MSLFFFLSFLTSALAACIDKSGFGGDRAESDDENAQNVPVYDRKVRVSQTAHFLIVVCAHGGWLNVCCASGVSFVKWLNVSSSRTVTSACIGF